MRWQPIETAPKDGSRFLFLMTNGHVVDSKDAGWPADWDGFTHWAPLSLPGEPDEYTQPLRECLGLVDLLEDGGADVTALRAKIIELLQ